MNAKIVKYKFDNEVLEIVPKSTLFDSISSSGKVMLPISHGYKCCLPESILYAKGESCYTEVYFKDGTKILIAKTLKIIEGLLPHNIFFRIHKSFIVNTHYIEDLILKTNQSYVTISGSIDIPISRNKKHFFR